MKSDLYLFVADRSTIPDAPTGNRLQVEQVNRLTTASWTVGEKVYVLAAEGDETFLRRFL
ncbi:MAG: hypothetical protein EPO07_18145 [Verrucomicrobia bacterium]|nr:MAG: hypothetical protein EPO07_18145 [Verrucomicrobiota bacterium]